MALALVLSLTAQQYGFHRDELYFRALDPEWGYVDQPPLLPVIASALTGLVDEPWLLRVPATILACSGVLVAALIAREVSGGRLAQALAAWGIAGAAFPLTFAHVLITATVDLLVWPLVCLLAIRAVRRAEPRWWVVAGVVVGAATYAKLLVAVLIAGIVIGLIAAGPRRSLRQPGFWIAATIALLIAAPNVVFQATNDWPQLRMGAALGQENGAEVRAQMWPFLLLLLGPLLVPIWVAGAVRALRAPALRFVPIATGVVIAFTFVSGSQFYYPVGVLTVLYTIGCVPAERLARRHRWVPITAIAVNSAVSAVIALPLIPLGAIGQTPVPAINQITQDSIGWPEYAEQISVAAASANADAIIASNYGEAGAVDRYAAASGAPPVYSGHNALWAQAAPPESADTIVVVGGQVDVARRWFDCEQVGTFDNGLGVDGEEQGEPIAVCRDPRVSWARMWPAFAHLD